MANIPAKLLHRLVQLESRMVDASPRYFVVTEQIPENNLAQLPDGERIVLDCYRNDRAFVLARQRVTEDPNDQGQQCRPGEYLVDVLREVHAVCRHRKSLVHFCFCFVTPVAATKTYKSRRG
jgi:hypothetical protein